MPVFLIPLLAGGLTVKVLEDWFEPDQPAIPNYAPTTGFLDNFKTIATFAGIAAVTYAVVKWRKI